VLAGTLLIQLAPAIAYAAPDAVRAKSPPAYTAQPGRYRADANFRLTYTGSGNNETVYHSEPPNPGGRHDTNNARDSSTQRWALNFLRPLTIPRCGAPRAGVADPCLRIRTQAAATGVNQVAASVAHTHVDGLFPAQNRSIRCRMSVSTPAGARLRAAVRLRYSARARAITVTALIPVTGALTIMPGACSGQGDSIDGLADNYFTPGFSFSVRYGPERWFKSADVVIPEAVFHRAARIRIPLGVTSGGRPPRHCAVTHPEYERCTTGGAWSGVLTFTAQR
jgi:hypothetical protein